MSDVNFNSSNNLNKNKVKKDYILYFFIISFIFNILFILYFLTIPSLDQQVKNLYISNQNTYKQIINLKSILDGKK